MRMICLILMLAAASGAAAADLLKPGLHTRKLTVDGLKRSYLVKVPATADVRKPVPVVLVLHGAGMNARLMIPFCGMNAEAERSGFVAVYPNGTGAAGTFLTWNSGGVPMSTGRGRPDDVAFLRAMLDDLATVVPVDAARVHVAGLSNGGMMAYKLAAEMSDRIASIAAVAGTMTTPDPKPGRPVPVLHVHGTADRIVPFNGPGRMGPRAVGFRSVFDSVATWARVNGCPDAAKVAELPDASPDDGTRVSRHVWAPGRNGAEVVLLRVAGGGHTWPGQQPMVGFIGKSTMDIDGNAMIWQFFKRHPMPTPATGSVRRGS